MTLPTMYTTTQIADALGIPVRKLITFEERGYLKPSIQSASGHGSRRLWSFTDAVRCGVVAYLANVFSVDFLRVLAPHLADDAAIGEKMSWCIFVPPDFPPAPGTRPEVTTVSEEEPTLKVMCIGPKGGQLTPPSGPWDDGLVGYLQSTYMHITLYFGNYHTYMRKQLS
jgi:hypothetical protein